MDTDVCLSGYQREWWRKVNRLAQRHTVSGKDWKGAQVVWIKAPTQAASDPLAILFF